MVRIDRQFVHGVVGVLRGLSELSKLPPLRSVGNATMDVGPSLEPASLSCP